MLSFARLKRMFALPLFALVLLLGFSAPLQAAADESKVITTERLEEMLDKKKDFTLVDARTKEEYQDAHIGKAVNNFDELAALLSADRNHCCSMLFLLKGV